MAIDPNVQVAIVSVVGIAITTVGVVVAAMINNQKERGKAASAGVEAGLDERNILERMLALIEENERKEDTITRLKKELREEKAKNRVLRANAPKEDESLE